MNAPVKETPLDESKLREPSKKFLEAFLDWRPEWVRYCYMEEKPYGFDLAIRIPSPTNDPNLGIFIWYCNDESDISIEFGGFHTHGDYWVEISKNRYKTWNILKTIQKIVEGKLICFSYGPDFDKHDVLYLESRFQIEEELTSPYSSGEIRIQSWDGAVDTKLSVNNIDSWLSAYSSSMPPA